MPVQMPGLQKQQLFMPNQQLPMVPKLQPGMPPNQQPMYGGPPPMGGLPRQRVQPMTGPPPLNSQPGEPELGPFLIPIEANAPLPYPLTRADLIHKYGFVENEAGFLEPSDLLLKQQPDFQRQSGVVGQLAPEVLPHQMPPPGAEILPMPPEPAEEYDTEDDIPPELPASDPSVPRSELSYNEQIRLGLADESLARWPLSNKLKKLKPHERHRDNPFHEPKEGEGSAAAEDEQYVPTEAELARYENDPEQQKKDGGILKKDSDEDENQNEANLTAEWADAPTDFKAIPVPYKEKNIKKVKFQQSADDDEPKKDNK